MDGIPPTTLRSHAQPMFYRIAVATQTAVGESYFAKVTRTIRESWHVAAAFVATIDPADATRAWIVAMDSDVEGLGRHAQVSGTPWFEEAESNPNYHLEAPEKFAHDPILGVLGARTYISVPLTSADGQHLGNVGLIDSRRWHPNQVTDAEALLRLIAPRASAELERLRTAREARIYRRFADACRDAIVRWSTAGRANVTYANAAFEQLIGYSAWELATDASDVLAPLVAAAGDADGKKERDARLTRKDGSQVDVTFRLAITGGDPLGLNEYECVLRLLDDEWASGAERPAGALTRAVLDSVEFPVIIIREDSSLYMNRRAEAITGARAEELLALRIVVQRGGSDLSLTVRDWLNQVRRAKSGKTMIRLRTRRGGERALEIRSKAITVHGSVVLVLTATDLTDEHRHRDDVEEGAALKRMVLDSVGFELLVLDGLGNVIWVNDRWNERAHDGSAHPCLRAVELGDQFTEQCRERAAAGDARAQEMLVAIGSVASGSLPYATTEYETPDTERDARSYVMVVTPLPGRAGVVILHTESTYLTRRTREAGEKEMRERALLEALPDQVARITRDGEIVEVIGPTYRAPVVPPLTRGSFRTNLRDMLPESQAETLLQAIREATQANMMVFSSLRLTYDESERLYEARVVPMEGGSDVLVVLRDRSAEQWAPAMNGGGEAGSRRPKIVQENLYSLTFREVAVLELVAHGASDKEIAAKLGVSVFTVNKHVSRILHKMGASSRTEASIRTLREGLFVS